MSPIARGFFGKRRDAALGDRLPPGQYPDRGFPGPVGRPDAAHAARSVDVRDPRRGRAGAQLDVGRVPRAARARRSRRTSTASPSGRSSTRPGRASRSTRCSTASSIGGALRRSPFCDGGYTTNLPLADVTGGKAWVAVRATTASRSSPSTAARPACSCPHLYFWKSAKWVRGLELPERRRARLLGAQRLPRPRRPVAGAALLGRLTPRAGAARRCAGARGLADKRPRRRSAATLVLDADGWPGHRAGQHVDVRLTAEDGYQAAAQLLDRLARRGRARSRSPSSGSTTARSRRTSSTRWRAGDELELRGPIGG